MLPLDPAVVAHPGVVEHAALGRHSRAAQAEREGAVDEFVAGGPVGGAREELAQVRRAAAEALGEG